MPLDRRRYRWAVALQMATSLLDLAGVLLVGILGVLATAGVQGVEPPPSIESILGRLGLADLPLTRADIADFLGLTIETVSRQLTKLRKASIIEIENNRHVHVPDMERLERAAGN